MTLVRLLQAKLVTPEAYEELKEARPVAIASSLGYQVHPEEWRQEPTRWRLDRFPRRFVRVLTAAIRADRMSPASAAGLTGLTLDEMAELAFPPMGDGDDMVTRELKELDVVRHRVPA